MRKRIDGHNYNTEKAISVSGKVYDEDGFTRVLYRTRAGHYFVLELTGLPSRDWYIWPITREQAIQFLIERELFSALSREFPEQAIDMEKA